MSVTKRRGISIVEVLVALTLIGVTGGAYLALIAETSAHLASAARREERVHQAVRVLEALELAPRDTLLNLAGRRFHRGHLVTVSATASGLFSIRVADAESQAELAATHVFRAVEEPHAR
jgi:Tfp pilus assembly protein PilV